MRFHIFFGACAIFVVSSSYAKSTAGSGLTLDEARSMIQYKPLDEFQKAFNKGDLVIDSPVGKKLLGIAAGAGKVEILNFLIKQGANVNEKGKHGMTPLMDAVFGSDLNDWVGSLECVKALIAQGADVTAVIPFSFGEKLVDFKYTTEAISRAMNGTLEENSRKRQASALTANTLREYMENNGVSDLTKKIVTGEIEVDLDDKLALGLAASGGYADLVTIMISKATAGRPDEVKAYVNEAGLYGMTPLMQAVFGSDYNDYKPCVDCVKALVAAGADYKARMYGGGQLNKYEELPKDIKKVFGDAENQARVRSLVRALSLMMG